MVDGRAPSTVNAYTAIFVAGLNAAIELGYVGNPTAWQIKRLASDSEDEGTAVFLTPDQRRAILAAARPDAAAFFRAIELTGCRPGELARAVVGDFDGQTIKLSHRKGKPPKLRTRYTVLSAGGIKHFERATKDKPPTALLFAMHDKYRWRKGYWADAFNDAIANHNRDCAPEKRLPVDIGLYSFRHSRISELLQIHGVDPLTAAQQTGTSVAMIEETYFKFIPAALQEKLAAVRDA
jgi:integrase